MSAARIRCDLCLQSGNTLLERVVGEHRTRRGRFPPPRRPGRRADAVPLLLLARPAFERRDELTADQPLERVLDRRQLAEGVQPVGALLQLTRRLRAPEHQDAEHRHLVAGEAERLLEQLTVFHRAAAWPARESRPLLAPEPLQRLTDRRLVVVDDGITVRRLVAGEAKRVQGQGVGVGRRPLLLDQAAEHPDLDGIRVHGESLRHGPATVSQPQQRHE